MGSSDFGSGSGGAWSGSGHGVNTFIDEPTEDRADRLVRRGLEALDRDTNKQKERDLPNDDPLPQIAPLALPIPGLRVRPGSGAGGPGGGGGGGGSGARHARSNSGGGRSARHAARAGGRALAAGFALRDGSAKSLAALGLEFADLSGLGVFDQINLILNVTIPATGSPLEFEMRQAGAGALIRLLKDDESSPVEVVREFVVEFIFQSMVAEWGAKFRDGSRPGASLADGERLLRNSIVAYAGQVDVPIDGVSAEVFEAAINSVTEKTQELAEQ